MTRSFLAQPVDSSLIDSCVELALRAPSAGKSQGFHLLLLEAAETSRYWDIAMPSDKREGFVFPGLLQAPCIALALADSQAYLDRYSEPDKAATGLGDSTDAWVAPYWTIDASFSTMTFLLALEDAGLGALFFAHANESALRSEFSIPESVQILGTIAFGYAATESRKGRSSSRPTKNASHVVHRSTW
jgi:nitroreductase